MKKRCFIIPLIIPEMLTVLSVFSGQDLTSLYPTLFKAAVFYALLSEVSQAQKEEHGMYSLISGF